MKKSIFPEAAAAVFLMLLISVAPVAAHQPRITESRVTRVSEPEISKAYYGELEGQPHVYVIESSRSFDLYVNVLVPDIKGQTKEMSVAIYRNGDRAEPLAMLDGVGYKWKSFWEPFAGDRYWMGPEFKTKAQPGKYEIEVTDPGNDSKYALAIGEIESFNAEESSNAVKILPKIKKDFFRTSPASFALSPFGLGYIALVYGAAFLTAYFWRRLRKKYRPSGENTTDRNIGNPDRLLRLVLGIALLGWAITTTWHPLLLFISGFAVYEALVSWCPLYAALGRNTCPLDPGKGGGGVQGQGDA